MHLRKEIYAKEAAALLRVVTVYRVVLEAQIYRFFPGKETVVKNLLRHLERQGRIIYCQNTMRYAAAAADLRQTDKSMLQALWVLVDFIDKVEFHSPTDFPGKIVFFAGSEMFEIIHIPYDSELLIGHVLASRDDGESKQIVIVDTAEQIKNIHIPSVTAFCTVGADGHVQYYKFR